MYRHLAILILAISAAVCQTQVNVRPIVGIYTAPSEYKQYPPSKHSYIAASYIKNIESAGAQAVPIPYDATPEYLDDLFSKINGIFFPGGDVAFAQKDSYNIIFLKNAAYLLQKAKNATDDGDFFPVWGTCQGFQLISYIESGFDESILKAGYNDTSAHTISDIDLSSRLYSNMPTDLLQWVQTFPAVYYHHNVGVQIQSFMKNKILGENLKPTSSGVSVNGQPFVASFESFNYPIYGSQFHPEKNLFEWKVDAPHDFKSDQVTQYFANFFVNLTRSNMHSFNGTNEENQYLIYRYPVYALEDSSFTQIYIIPNYVNSTNQKKFTYPSFLK